MNKSGPDTSILDSTTTLTKTYTPLASSQNSDFIALRRILFLGGGNLSYELSFAKKHPELTREMVATTYEPLDTFEKNSIAVKNKNELLELGVEIYHDIDATRLMAYHFLLTMKPKQIYFCHPHSGNPNFLTSRLLEDFFSSVANFISRKCTIHIIRVRGGNYEMKKSCLKRKFHFTKQGHDLIAHYKDLYGFNDIRLEGFQLTAKHRFNEKRYPGYNHVQTNNSSQSALIIGKDNSLEYVFSRSSDVDLSDPEYFSEDVDSDDGSDAELFFKPKEPGFLKYK